MGTAEVIVLVGWAVAWAAMVYLRFYDRFSLKSPPDPPPTTVPSQEPVPTVPFDPVKGYINLPPRQFAAFHLATQRGMTYRAEFDARVTMVGAQGLDSVDWPKHGPVVLTLSGKATRTVAAVLQDAKFQAEGDEWVWRSQPQRNLYAVGGGET